MLRMAPQDEDGDIFDARCAARHPIPLLKSITSLQSIRVST
jgi:hypothetical protein